MFVGSRKRMINSKLLYTLFLLFISLSSSNSIHKCHEEQRDALISFKQNISSSNGSYHDYYRSYDSYCKDVGGSGLNWDPIMDCCDWGGVTCNNFTGDVIRLNLRCNMLQGVLKLDKLLSSLPHLRLLDLSYNNLSVVTNNATYYVNPNFQALGLASCRLTVFPELLRAMKNLQSLDLANNYISGKIPDWTWEIGGNKLLYLDLSYNSISGNLSQFRSDGLKYLNLRDNLIKGSIPPSICTMNHLELLDLSYNSFGGMVPPCLGNISSSLASLDVGYNMLQGSFPPSICNMTNLLHLYMSENRFGGVIPQCFGNITTSLAIIDLGNNEFRGTIPYVYKDCNVLEGLILNGNRLEGEVPGSLFKCQFLKILDLGHNMLNDTFPRWLGDLPKLQVLVLRSNNLHGTIETSSIMDFPFRSLKVFDISNNEFVGRLPGNYFETFNAIKDVDKNRPKPKHVDISIGFYYSISDPIMKDDYPETVVKYTILDLSSNKFEGEIPNIGSLSSLVVLNLSRNNLNGQIPNALGNLINMESLDLSSNQLTGEIPQSLATLNFLAILNLSRNDLVGCIPVGTQFSSFESSTYEGNAGLSGLPLTQHCEKPSSPQLEDVEDSIFAWKAAMLGFGCGILLGLVMGYRMLSTGTPKWFNAIADVGDRTIPKRRNKRK